MKKLVYGTLFLAIVGISIQSCKKDLSRPNQEELKFDSDLNIASDGRMLVFKTVEDYEKVVDNPTESIRKTFLSKVSKMNHITHFENMKLQKSNIDIFGDEYISQILNNDWIVQIGDYLYRVNKELGKVFVLPAANISEYNDLVAENKNNPNIRRFSTDDSVIELAESGAEGEKGLFCSENQASNNDNLDQTYYSAYEPYTNPVANSNHQYVRRYESTCKMNYLKLGIYYNLQAKLEVKGRVSKSSSSTGTYGINSFETLNCIAGIRFSRIYKIRCQAETGWNSGYVSLTNSNLYKAEYNSYQGSKGIKKFWLKCGFYYKTFTGGSEIAVFPTNLPGETLYHKQTKDG
ncbi:MAG: hypothetical protein ACK476_04315, partial [Fluviicola sp.]